VTTEDAALDSFQNLLFSIARFREITGEYPTRITVVGHSFKRHRFERLHRHALRWPKLRFKYEGVPLGNEADEYEAASGEVRSSSLPSAFSLSLNLSLLWIFLISWPTRIRRTLRTCMAAMHRSSKNAPGGTFTCEAMATMSAHRSCAS